MMTIIRDLFTKHFMFFFLTIAGFTGSGVALVHGALEEWLAGTAVGSVAFAWALRNYHEDEVRHGR